MNSHLKLKNKLKEYRRAANLTQTQLAEKVGTSKNTISSIETGQFSPTAYLAALLCSALSCKFEELFYFEKESEVLKMQAPNYEKQLAELEKKKMRLRPGGDR